ncbi:MAG: hypothetical protein ACXVGA_09635 [Mycobacteriaceae bacterium]
MTTWERGVVEALVSIDGPADGPDGAALRETLPHLVVTGECDCGCPSFFVRDARQAADSQSDGAYHCSNAVTSDGGVGLLLLLQNDRPWSVDVMLPPDMEPSSPDARPDPATLVVTDPYSG